MIPDHFTHSLKALFLLVM
jgi:hypothetical protein